MKRSILVLAGGDSDEREVSLRSGKAVAKALIDIGHEVLEYDPASGTEGLEKLLGSVDCVFPILHGKGGEDGSLQEFLESRSIPYLGSTAEVSRLCFDKVAFKQKLQQINIKLPADEVVAKDSFVNSPLAGKPYVLKPIDGGSSIDTFIVRDPHKANIRQDVFVNHRQMLLEELIEGTEITLSILGDKALPVTEIIPPEGQEFDYDNKYNGATLELCPPPHVASDKQQEAQRLAEKIHTFVGARHLSRIDMMLDANGQLYVLELNTIPGLTDQSLFPKAAQAAGYSMSELVAEFVRLATGK